MWVRVSPESPEGSLLILKDAIGEIVRVGYAPEANNTPVYLVARHSDYDELASGF